MLRLANETLAATVAIATLALGGLALAPAVQARERAAEVVVGTYQTARVVQATGLPMPEMEGVRERMERARREGDQQTARDLYNELEYVRQEAMNGLLANIEAALPRVAERTGVQVVALEFVYTAPGVTTRDVTEEIVRALADRGERGSEEGPEEPSDEASPEVFEETSEGGG